MTLFPFRALRPRPEDASRIAAVPYDVVTRDEARSLADGNPLSFLRVSRAEIELASKVDPYSNTVYQRARENFTRLKEQSFVLEAEPALYFYRLRRGRHAQIGLAGCFSLDEYDNGLIKKHERTRRDKEDDRTQHLMALAAQTGPIFVIYRANGEEGRQEIATVASRITRGEPLIDFDAPDLVRHTIWRVTGADCGTLVSAFARIPALYIADGHHRAASATRARDECRKRGPVAADAEVNRVLAVAFPHDEVQVLPYNRVVKDLGGLSIEQFLEAVGQRFSSGHGPSAPASRGEIAMYVRTGWRTLRARQAPDWSDVVASLDVSVLQDQLLAPILGIADLRTDPRIEFVAAARGTSVLEQAVDSGQASVAFSLFPVSVTDLMAVADQGAILPPKSSWFEPKLRDGLLIHPI